LKNAHQIESGKSRQSKLKKMNTSSELQRTDDSFAHDPAQFFQNIFVLWGVAHSIPMNAFQSPYFAQIQNRLPGVVPMSLDRDTFVKQLLRQYLTIKSKITAELQSAKTFFGGMPFLSVNLDLYKDPKQSKQYMAIRITWVDGVLSKLVSRCIAARHYNPTFKEKQRLSATTLLSVWYKAVVREYKITDGMVLSGSGDSGSDVKKVMQEHVGSYGFREWCISHMLNRCFIDAFGSSVDKKKSKHPESRAVIALLRKTVESLNKSSYLQSSFEGYQKQRTGKAPLKVRNAPQHRWGSMEDTIFTVLRLWVDIERAFREAGRSAAWDLMVPHKATLEEFYSILKPFRRIQSLAQTSKFNTPWVLIQFFQAYRKICTGLGNTLTMHWPPAPVRFGRTTRPVEREGGDVQPLSRTVIQKLRLALDKRYFYRYHPFDSLKDKDQWSSLTEANADLSYFREAYVFELLLLLHPELYKGAFVADNCDAVYISENCLARAGYREVRSTKELRTRHAKLLLAAFWKKIRELALVAARSTPSSVARRLDYSHPVGSAAHSQDDDLPRSPPRKRQSMMGGAGYGSPDTTSTSDSNSPLGGDASLADQVDTEIKRWRSLGRVWDHRIEDRLIKESETAIDWWIKWGESESYPVLKKVALALFSLLPGSGALECDIGCFKDIVQPKRASLRAGVVEMNVVVGLNKDLHELDVSKICKLGESWEAMIPDRPSSPVGYHDGEEQAVPYEEEGAASDEEIDAATVHCDSDSDSDIDMNLPL
jgi:hypothetical protein